MSRIIKIVEDIDCIDINQIKSYAYKDGNLIIETENENISFDKKDIPELDVIAPLVVANLRLNHPTKVNVAIDPEEVE